MESELIAEFKTKLQKIANLYVGYYPYDYPYIQTDNYATLIKLSDAIISTDGHHNYDKQCNTQLILFSNDGLSNTLDKQTTIVVDILEVLHTNAGKCNYGIIGIGDVQITTGDINDYALPSSTGYNGNVIVRRININYTIRKII